MSVLDDLFKPDVDDQADGKKKPKKRASARALEECRARGWRAQAVERWIPSGRSGDFTQGKRVDLFGCIDIIALDGKAGVLGIQATSEGQRRDHVTTALEHCEDVLDAWLEAGNRFQIWSYEKRVPPGGGRERWVLSITPIEREEQEHGQQEEDEAERGEAGERAAEAQGGREAGAGADGEG